MTHEEMQELKRLAESATKREWRYSVDKYDGIHAQHERVHGPTPTITSTVNGDYFTRDMRFIAAANPAVVLALIARIEELEGK